MPLTMIHDAWEFCTNGYPDPDALVNYLKLVIANAEDGVRMYGGSAIGRGYTRLIHDTKCELRTMGYAV